MTDNRRNSWVFGSGELNRIANTWTNALFILLLLSSSYIGIPTQGWPDYEMTSFDNWMVHFSSQFNFKLLEH